VGDVLQLATRVTEGLPGGWVFCVPPSMVKQMDKANPEAILPSLLLAAMDHPTQVVLMVDGIVMSADDIADEGMRRYQYHLKEKA